MKGHKIKIFWVGSKNHVSVEKAWLPEYIKIEMLTTTKIQNHHQWGKVKSKPYKFNKELLN